MIKRMMICDSCGTSCDGDVAHRQKWLNLTVNGAVDDRENIYWTRDYCGVCAPRVLQVIKTNFKP